MSAPELSRKAVIGDVNNDFWVYDSTTGFDLTHPASPTAPRIASAITLQTTTAAITVDPRKSALVIIDMQNFFLSPALGRSAESKGLQAQKQLLEHAIPAARKAGIQIAWLNWGLSDSDLGTVPPAVHRAFGFASIPAADFAKLYATSSSSPLGTSTTQSRLSETDLGKDPRMYKGLGQQLGSVKQADGQTVSAGRMLMRRQWNTELSVPLAESFQASSESSKPDVWLNKSRLSGLHVPGSPAGLYFQNHGIKTLFFAGVNTDQCVNATLADAFCQGYDCVLLRDGCATSSPTGAQECVENNVARTMGFVTDCQAFAKNIDESLQTSGL